MTSINKQRITPAIAQAYLQNNNRNRKSRMPAVYRYAADMKAGRWIEDTGDTIKISATGNVLDGQHRLMAIVEANVAVQMYVVTGLQDSIFPVLDTGMTRSATDAFYIAGAKHNCKLPSMIMTYNMLKSGRKVTGGQKNNRLTTSELLAQYKMNQAHWHMIGDRASDWYMAFAKVIPPSVIGGLYAYLLEIDEWKAQSFMNQLCTGEGVENRTIYVLRNKYIEDKSSYKKMPINVKIALALRTWECYLQGKELKYLRYAPENSTP